MTLKAFLVVWQDKVCIEVTEYEDSAEAARVCTAIIDESARTGNLKSATVYHASSREMVEEDPACCVGGRRDDKFRDEMDYSSDQADEN